MQTEKLAADTLLNRGIKVPLQAPLLFRLFGKKTISLVVKAPCVGTLLWISSFYVGMGISKEQLRELDQESLHQLFLAHGFTTLRICATGILNSFYLNWLNPLLAYYLKWKLNQQQLQSLAYLLVTLSGYENFPHTIRWIERMTVTKPNLSQTPRES